MLQLCPNASLLTGKDDVCRLKSGRPGETVSFRKGALTHDLAHQSFLVLRFRVRQIVLRGYLAPRTALALLLPTSDPCQARSTRKLSPPVRSTPLGCELHRRRCYTLTRCTADCVPEFCHLLFRCSRRHRTGKLRWAHQRAHKISES